jgi:hypothetical protein
MVVSQLRENYVLRVLVTIFTILSLSSCGGGGGSSPAPTVDDTTPNVFSFIEEKNASLNQVYISDSIKVEGINAAAPISIIGGEYKINGAAFTNSNGSISNGQSVQVKQTSSNSTASKTDVTLTIGGVSGIYSVTTFEQDIDPDTFTFTAQTNVSLNAVIISNAITVSGLNVASSIKITNGDYYINDVLNASDTVVNGDVVKVQVTASNLRNTPVTANLSIGNVSKPFTVTTLAGATSVLTTPGILNLVESPTTSASEITVKLSSLPAGGTADVVFDVSSSNALVTVSPATITLTPQNWDTGVVLKVLPENDNIANNGQFSDIKLTINKNLTTDTSGYAGLAVMSIRANVTDDDTSGIIIESATTAGVPISNLNGVNEGVTQSFKVRLQSEPKKAVTLTVVSSNLTVANVSTATSTLSFNPKVNQTASNWDKPQLVTFTTSTDGVFDSDKTVKFDVKVTSPDDGTGYVQPLNKIVSATIVNINPPHNVSNGKSFLEFLNKSAPRNNEDAAAGAAYYAAVDPNSYRLTLSEFKAFNNGLSDAQNAVYVNDADLGFGRRMYLTTSLDGTVASCVENYTPLLNGLPNVNADAAEKLALASAGNPADIVATVCMEYSGTPGSVTGGGSTAGLLTGRKFVKFFSYAGDGSRIAQADLDGQGLKTQPGLCNTCHGGQGNSLLPDGTYPLKGDTGAQFLPWDLDTLVFSANPAQNLAVRDSYENLLRQFNEGVLATYPQPQTFSFRGNVTIPAPTPSPNPQTTPDTPSITETTINVSGVKDLITEFTFSIDDDGAGGPGVSIINGGLRFELLTPTGTLLWGSTGRYSDSANKVTATGIKNFFNSDEAFGKYLDILGGPTVVGGNITGNIIGVSEGYINNSECVGGIAVPFNTTDIGCTDSTGVWKLKITNSFSPAGSLKGWSVHFNGIPDQAYLPASVELIRGWYGGLDINGKLKQQKFNGAFIPVGWRQANNANAVANPEILYRDVIAPTCRACHIQRGTMANNDIDFSTYAKFMKFASKTKRLVYDKGIMPMAKRTFDNHFWSSTKPDILAQHMPGYVAGQVTLQPGRNIANAGIARTGQLAVYVASGTAADPFVKVKLNGSASVFANDYKWTVTGPAPSAAVVPLIVDTAEQNLAINTSFIVKQAGRYTVTLDTSGTGPVSATTSSSIFVDGSTAAMKPVSFKGKVIFYDPNNGGTSEFFVSSFQTCSSTRCHGGSSYNTVRRTGRLNFIYAPNDYVSLPTVTQQNENYRLLRDRIDTFLPMDSLVIRKGLNKIMHGGEGRYVGSYSARDVWSEVPIADLGTLKNYGEENYYTFLRWVLEGANNN